MGFLPRLLYFYRGDILFSLHVILKCSGVIFQVFYKQVCGKAIDKACYGSYKYDKGRY